MSLDLKSLFTDVQLANVFALLQRKLLVVCFYSLISSSNFTVGVESNSSIEGRFDFQNIVVVTSSPLLSCA